MITERNSLTEIVGLNLVLWQKLSEPTKYFDEEINFVLHCTRVIPLRVDF